MNNPVIKKLWSARTPTEAGVPGARQPAVERIYVESDCAKLRTCVVRDMTPGLYQKVASQQVALAEAYRNNGIEVVNGTAGMARDKHPSVLGGRFGKVIGNLLIRVRSPGSGELFEHDDQLVQLDIAEHNLSPTRRGMIGDAGDLRVFPGHVVFGIGVADPSHIEDTSKARSSGDESSAEVLRRMIEPFGWRFSVIYYDCRLATHLDGGLALIDEGLLASPKDFLWTPLPDEFRDWEVTEVPWDEHAIGATDLVPLGDKKVVLEARAKKLARKLAKRGYIHVPVEYRDIVALGGGLHCSTMPLWRENSQ